MGAFERVAQEMARSPILRGIGAEPERDAEGKIIASRLPERREDGTSLDVGERVGESGE